jgi:aldehyde:ferredoxin oxidoreductase
MTFKKVPLKKNFAKTFIGGRGFNMKFIYDMFDPEINDPFDPRNIICISAGALTGTFAPSSGRFNISVGRSPLTGGFGDGNAGGFFGPEMKFAGYDSIIIEGSSEKPVYIWINDDDVEIRNAGHVWGRSVWESDKIIKEETDQEASVLAIGQAGENKVAIACVICNLSRAVGANGIGAVFGSKNLKAVAVKGTKGIKIADTDGFWKACEDSFNQIITHPLYSTWKTYGTTVLLGIYQQSGCLPTRNWQESTFEGWEQIDGQAFLETYVVKHKGCFNCPLSCSRFCRVEEGKYQGTYGEGPEYEATDGFGAKCGVSDKAVILRANQLCNMYGLCVVQMSNIICTSMHLWQDGIIDEKDTGGIILEWGNGDAIIEMIESLTFLKGFGKIFVNGIVQGIKEIARNKGVSSEKLERYIIHTKGMSYSAADVRALKGVALAYATATRGGDHLRGIPTIEAYGHWYKTKPDDIVKSLGVPEEIVQKWISLNLLEKSQYQGKGYLVKYYQDQCALADALGICKFITSWRFGVGPLLMAKLFSTGTGITYSWRDMLQAGERIYVLEYAIQRRFGFRRKDDYPPIRFFEEPIRDGLNRGEILKKEEYDKMLSEYYNIRGFDSEGVPTKEKLEELGLKDVAEDLVRRGIIKGCCNKDG